MTYKGSSDAQRKAVSKYQKVKVDNITVRVPKGERDHYSHEAKDRNLSLNEFAVKAMDYVINHNIRLKRWY